MADQVPLRRVFWRAARSHVLAALVLATAGTACSGSIQDTVGGGRFGGGTGGGASGIGGGSGPGTAGTQGTCVSASCDTETPVPSSEVPRLSHSQWSATTRDLLFLDAAPDTTGFSADAPTGTKFDNNGGKLTVSQGLWEDYQTASEELAASLAGDSKRLAKLIPANLPSDATAAARAIVTSFGRRAFRRPLTSAEKDSYTKLFMDAAQLYPQSTPQNAGVQMLVVAMLQSPNFVYRIEHGTTTAADGTVTLNDFEIASRLSFMIWDSMPDDELLDVAEKGALHDDAQVSAQAERMLADPKAATKLADFHRQLLELARYDAMHPTGVPADIGTSMRKETEHFVQDAVIDHQGGVKELFTASYSYVNKDLADIYGLSGSFNDEFVRVDLDPKARAGLLTQPGFLTYRSGGTAPILRGVFINLNFLCADLPPPPVFTPPMMKGTTRRERIESVTGKGTCGEGCHARFINPAGFPLEFFDDVGRYRTMDNGEPINAQSAYPFKDGTQNYDGPIAWSKAMVSSLDTHACYVKHWLEFGYGREAQKEDKPLIARVAQASRDHGISVRDILVELVKSPSFRLRKQEAP